MSYKQLTFIKRCRILTLWKADASQTEMLKKLAYTNQQSAANLNEIYFGGTAEFHNINVITHKRMQKGVTN